MPIIDGSSMTRGNPPPPPLPKYDPNEEAPMWDWTRLRRNLPVDKGDKPWMKIGDQPASPDDPDWRGVIRSKVREYPMPDSYKFGRYNSPKYFWFDTPDYVDPFKKLWYSTKLFTWTGVLAGSVIALSEGKKFTLANNIDLIKRITGPWILAGVAASSCVIVLANLRGKKDDYYNYAIAGLLMGGILGRKSHIDWFRATILSVPAAVASKYNAEINGQLVPQYNWRNTNLGLAGQSAENGFFSGDLRFGIRGTHGEPGRDVRKQW